jgi:hypothetical protein
MPGRKPGCYWMKLKRIDFTRRTQRYNFLLDEKVFPADAAALLQ